MVACYRRSIRGISKYSNGSIRLSLGPSRSSCIVVILADLYNYMAVWVCMKPKQIMISEVMTGGGKKIVDEAEKWRKENCPEIHASTYHIAYIAYLFEEISKLRQTIEDLEHKLLY